MELELLESELKLKKGNEKPSYHLWGIPKYELSKTFHNTWAYIKPCTPDRRALISVDTRKYNELEVRQSGGRLAVRFRLKDGIVE